MKLYLIDNKTAPKSQRFRWRLLGRKGNIVAASFDGFSTTRGCARNVAAVMESLAENFQYSIGAVHFSGRKPIKVRQ